MDPEINTMTIENTEAVSQLRTENATDSDPANVDTISNASDGQTEDKTPKQNIANIEGNNKKDASMTKSKDLKRKRESHPSTADMVMVSITNVDGKNKKDASMTKSKDLKRKRESRPSTADMVMASIKSLRKRKGASLKDISKYMKENYEVNTKRLKLHINRFLERSVESDTLEKVSGNADEERFKIKKAEKSKKEKKVKKNVKQNLMPKGGKRKQEKNTIVKRQVRK